MRGLVANAELEARRAPVHKLDGSLGLESGDSGVSIVGHDVTAVKQAGGHVLAVAGIALDHLVVGLEAGHGHLLDRVGLVRGLRSRDDRSIGNEREVDARVWHQVGLKFVEIDVERAIEAERRGNGRHNCQAVSIEDNTSSAAKLTLSNKPVEVLIVRALQAEVTTADVVDCLVVHHKGAVSVLEGGVGSEDRVVGLNHRGRSLGGRVDAELKLALLAIVHRKTLHQQGSKARAGTATERVEDQEALETTTVVGDTADLVEHLVNQLLANGVVATRIVVGCIFLSGDHVLGMEKTAVGSSADLVNNIRLKVAIDRSRDIFSVACTISTVSSARTAVADGKGSRIPVSEKKVLKPWSGSAALRSSVRKPSGWMPCSRQ